jgi:hypothetical protein
MKAYCKLFETEKYGQILVMNDTVDDGRPAVKVLFNLSGDFGVCSIDAIFKDSDSGLESADKAFNEMTEEKAYAAVSSVVDDFLAN